MPIKNGVDQLFVFQVSPTAPLRYFLVSVAEHIAASDAVDKVAVTPELAREALRLNKDAQTLEAKHVAAADLSKPVIIASLWQEDAGAFRHVIIDGWHRVRKYVEAGCPGHLPGVVLSPEQTTQCEISAQLAEQGMRERFA